MLEVSVCEAAVHALANQDERAGVQCSVLPNVDLFLPLDGAHLGSALYPLARSNHEAHDKDVRFELTSMFHHTMWMGDVNYRMVGLSGRQVQHLIKNNKTSEMHARADGASSSAFGCPFL